MFLDIILDFAHTSKLFGETDITAINGRMFKEGTYLLVKDEKMKQRISNLFPHKKFGSVHRQFNAYGFIKTRTHQGWHLFYNEHFYKDMTHDDLSRLYRANNMRIKHPKERKDVLIARIDSLETTVQLLQDQVQQLITQQHLFTF